MKLKLKNLLLLLAAIILSCNSPRLTHAQFIGYVSQQTVTKKINELMIATTTHMTLQNLGQAGHSLVVSSTIGSCVTTLDGSTDNTTWFVLASTADTGNGVLLLAVANGYFPALRLTFNFEANPSCNTGQVTGSYAGYQTPLPMLQTFYGRGTPLPSTVASPVVITPLPAPWILGGFSCFNPNGSTAFLELFDPPSAPTLGTGYFFIIGIPAGGLYVHQSNVNYAGQYQLYAGAATTAAGSTAVSTALVCSFQFTNNGQIMPHTIASP
jgi:hypothetical protein